MTDPEPQTDDLHEMQVRAVSRAVTRLVNHTGYPPETIIEGALRAAAAVGLGMGSSAEGMAELVENFAEGLRHLDKPNLRVVN